MRVQRGIMAIRRILAHSVDISPNLIVREAHNIETHPLQVMWGTLNSIPMRRADCASVGT